MWPEKQKLYQPQINISCKGRYKTIQMEVIYFYVRLSVLLKSLSEIIM